jgi:hypothetical protein
MICSNNVFNITCCHNTFGNACSNNTFGSNCKYNTFGNICSNNTFGIICDYNTFGVKCLNNTFDGNCKTNRFGNNCEQNNFGECCWGNILEENCKYINFITKNNGIQIYHKNITVGQGNEYMILNAKLGITDVSFQNVRIAPGCCLGRTIFDGKTGISKKEHIDILDGLRFLITNPKTGLSYDLGRINQPFSVVIGKTKEFDDDDGKPMSDYIFTATVGV